MQIRAGYPVSFHGYSIRQESVHHSVRDAVFIRLLLCSVRVWNVLELFFQHLIREVRVLFEAL